MPDFTLTCPIPLNEYPQVLLAHGGGGKLMRQLIEQLFAATFSRDRVSCDPTNRDPSNRDPSNRDRASLSQNDAALLHLPGQRIAFTTDSYVVQPLFFPGGDIGSLAIHGTVNDLATRGARPLYLSASFILEEGLPMATLWRIVQSMQCAAEEAGVQIVTGDTKVVDRGKGDGIFINTAGVGAIDHDQRLEAAAVQPGDLILLNGDLGRHGIAIMAVREGLEFETTIESDSAPLAALVQQLLAADIELHCLRDLTRGGLASALNEIADSANVCLQVDERAIPVGEQVRGACEILGFDPLYVANEGRLAIFLPEAEAPRALAILQAANPAACIIGRVEETRPNLFGGVILKSAIGASRILDMLSGEQLPRIC